MLAAQRSEWQTRTKSCSPEDSKAGWYPEDSKAEWYLEDSKARWYPEDSKAGWYLCGSFEPLDGRQS